MTDYRILLRWHQCKYFITQLSSMIYTDYPAYSQPPSSVIQTVMFMLYNSQALLIINIVYWKLNTNCVGEMKSHADIYAFARKPCEDTSNHLFVQPLWWYSVKNMEHMPNSWRHWCEQSKWKRLNLTLHNGVAVWWVVSKSASCCTRAPYNMLGIPPKNGSILASIGHITYKCEH